MKNPFVNYNRLTGEKTLKKWPFYTLFGLLFLLSLLLIFSLPSGVKAELQQTLPTLPGAAEGKNFRDKMDLYHDLGGRERSALNSRLDYLFSEGADSILEGFDDEASLGKEGYTTVNDDVMDDDLWSRSNKAQEDLRGALDFLSIDEGSSSQKSGDIPYDGWEGDNEEYKHLESLLRQRTEYLEQLIASLERQVEKAPEMSYDVKILENTEASTKSSSPVKAAPKAVRLSSDVVSGLGLERQKDAENGWIIPVITPQSQSIYVGELLEVRLEADALLPDGTVLEKGTRLFATTSLQGDRLMASFESVIRDGKLHSLNLEAYSPRDGLKGIEIENALKDNAVSDITGRLSSSASSSAIRVVSNASSALGYVAEEALRGVLQGGASYLSRKAQKKRVVIPSHLELYLK